MRTTDRPTLIRALALGLLLLSAGCAARGRTPPAEVPASALTSHVIIISVDGLGRDMVPGMAPQTMLQLREEGARAVNARTIYPSKTLPSHTSMLTGVDVAKHGITWNRNRTGEFGVVTVPTVFEVVHQAGLTTAMFVGKRKLKHLLRPNSLDFVFYPRTDLYLLSDRVADEAVRYLRFERPNLLFIHLPDPDLAGHAFGWGDRTYRRAVLRADAAVRFIWKAARNAYGDDFVLILTADHGGERSSHGSESDADSRIPWIVWGDSVRRGHTVEQPVRTFDTAATALWLLGIPVPADWDGEPVKAAFSN